MTELFPRRFEDLKTLLDSVATDLLPRVLTVLVCSQREKGQRGSSLLQPPLIELVEPSKRLIPILRVPTVHIGQVKHDSLTLFHIIEG